MDILLNGTVEAEPYWRSGLSGGALHVEVGMCRHDTTVETQEGPRGVFSTRLAMLVRVSSELALSLVGNLHISPARTQLSYRDRHDQDMKDVEVVEMYNRPRPASAEGGSSERMALAPRLGSCHEHA